MGSFGRKCGTLQIIKHLNLFGNEVFDFYNYILALFFCLRFIFGSYSPLSTCDGGSLGLRDRRDDCQCGAAGEAADGDQRRSA
jgi:hypothetical protein